MRAILVLLTLAPLIFDLISAATKRKTSRELDEWERQLNGDTTRRLSEGEKHDKE